MTANTVVNVVFEERKTGTETVDTSEQEAFVGAARAAIFAAAIFVGRIDGEANLHAFGNAGVVARRDGAADIGDDGAGEVAGSLTIADGKIQGVRALLDTLVIIGTEPLKKIYRTGATEDELVAFAINRYAVGDVDKGAWLFGAMLFVETTEFAAKFFNAGIAAGCGWRGLWWIGRRSSAGRRSRRGCRG